MNPMTNVKNTEKLNARELELGLVGGTASWHAEFKDSAWIFVGGLPYDLTEGDVICVFSQYGEIVNINLVRDSKSGKSKGFCFICYEDQRGTILAVDNFNGIELLSRTLRVNHVADYKMPKDHGDEDTVTRQLRDEGCAPQMESSAAEKEEELEKIKKDKKKKKKEKKKKTQKNMSDSEAELSPKAQKSLHKFPAKVKSEKADLRDFKQESSAKQHRKQHRDEYHDKDYDSDVDLKKATKIAKTEKSEYEHDKLASKSRGDYEDNFAHQESQKRHISAKYDSEIPQRDFKTKRDRYSNSDDEDEKRYRATRENSHRSEQKVQEKDYRQPENRNRDFYGDRQRDLDRENRTSHHSEKDFTREKYSRDDRDKDVDRFRDRNTEQQRESRDDSYESYKDRVTEQDRSRVREFQRDSEQDRPRVREFQREKYRESENSKEREGRRSRERSRERDSERSRYRDRDHGRDRERYSQRSRSRSRERKSGSKMKIVVEIHK